jgi:small-conductance mechanosensitive channel
MTDFLSSQFLDNTAQDWIIAAVLVVIVMVLVRTVIGVVLKRLSAIASKTETDVDDLVSHLLDKTKFLFVALLALYAGAISLTLPPEVDDLLSTILVLGFLIQGAFWANGIVNYMIDSWARRKFEADPTISTALGSVSFVIRFAVWATFTMLALDNLGIDVGPLVASLGIGGIAMALALQGVLGDLFASLSIIFDKPFVVGDYIQVGDLEGTVQHVGLKSTRIQALTGEQLVFSNADLLGSRIRNFQLRQERRCAFTLGVTYDTAPEKLERIPGLIREIIESRGQTRFDRSFFMVFGDSALNFETVYHMLVADFQTYGETHNAINLAIVRRFAEEGIEFAYPTQKIYVEGVNPGVPGGS